MGEETWKEFLAYDSPKGFRPPHWCSVLTEVTVFLVIGILAALLRFTDWAPVFQHQNIQLFCNDPAFQQESWPSESYLYYAISIIGSFFIVLICQIERSYYSLDPSYKLFSATQRFFFISLRPIGIFILGIFLTSVITDVIKVLVAYPRPYFFAENPSFCRMHSLFNVTLTLEERYGLTSFPCHLSSISAFVTFIASCYIHSSISLNSTPMLKPVLCGCFFILTVTGSIYRVNINHNHWLDIIFGIGIGSFFAYIMNLVLRQGYKSHKQVMTENAWKLLIPRVTIPETIGNSHNSRSATVRSTRSHSRIDRQTSRGRQPYWLSD